MQFYQGRSDFKVIKAPRSQLGVSYLYIILKINL